MSGSGKLTQEEVSKTMEFCFKAFDVHAPEKTEAVTKKLEMAMLANQVAAPPTLDTTPTEAKVEAKVEEKAIADPEGLSADELRILNTIRARQMMRREDTLSIDGFSNDAINGLIPVVERGSLGLRKAGAKSYAFSRGANYSYNTVGKQENIDKPEIVGQQEISV